MTLAEPPFTRELPPAVEEPHAKRWTKAEVYELARRGFFEKLDRKVYLFRGELIEEPMMTWEHATGVQNVSDYAYRRMSPAFVIRVQLPVEAPGDSIPQPDVAVFTKEQAARRPHPNAAELLIEIAFSSDRLDREKRHEYAAEAREYWILDVIARILLVYRNPHPDPAGLFGVAFDPPVTLAEGESVAPLCDPSAVVIVRDLLPPLM